MLMNKEYILTLKEFFLSIVFAVLFSMVLPGSILTIIQNTFIKALTLIPINMISLIIVNTLNALLILLLGLWQRESVSFFVVLNGFALGIMSSLFDYQIDIIIPLLLPHALFETAFIIIYCTEIKRLSDAYRTNDTVKFKKSKRIILFLCIPLLIFSALLEGVFQ